MKSLTCSKVRTYLQLPPPVVFCVFFIFTFWKTDSEESSCTLCCLKRQKKTEVRGQASENGENIQEPVNWTGIGNLGATTPNDSRRCFTLGGKRNCELPPVPVTTGSASDTFEGQNVDVTRPYSLCEPSESDPLYASVGVPGVSATPRTRLTNEIDGCRGGGVFAHNSAKPASSTAPVSAAAKKDELWAGQRVYATPGSATVDSEDSGSIAIPYYSSVLHLGAQDPTNADGGQRSSPFYQEEPVVSARASPAVYAQVQRKGVVTANGEASTSTASKVSAGVRIRSSVKSLTARYHRVSDLPPGPPVPSRSYRLSEVENLLNQRYRSQNSENAPPANQASRPHSATVRASMGLHLLGIFHSGLRRQSRGLTPRNSVHAEENRPVVADVVPPPTNRISGDYGTYASGKSGTYRNITVRESIASLRARNALPTFLVDHRRSLTALPSGQPSDAEYEGVYWYPGEDQVEDGQGGAYDAPVMPAPTNTEGSGDPGSDAYVEIPDGATRPQTLAGGCVFAVKLRYPSQVSSGDEIYAIPKPAVKPAVGDVGKAPSRSESPSVVFHTPPQQSLLPNANVSRILLEMRDFRYADSETDLSSSVTPPELIEPGVAEQSQALIPMKLHKVLMSSSPAPPPERPQKMTPLMERSVEAESVRSVTWSGTGGASPKSPSCNSQQRVLSSIASRPLPSLVHYENWSP